MIELPNENKLPVDDLQIPFADVAQFVRQLTHDLRNHLNAIELQSAFIKEIAEDAEVKAEVQRLRGISSEMGASLQRLTASLAPVKLTLMPYDGAAFLEDLRNKIATGGEATDETEWDVQVGHPNLSIDPQILQQAFLELFANASQHMRGAGPLGAVAKVKDGKFIFELHEPKANFSSAMENWGREPFRKVSHGHYGLGLSRARSIIEAHQGRMEARHDSVSSTLVTTVALPIVGAA